MTGTMLAHALAYARAGYPVFPVGKNKAPLTPHGFKDATTDEADIQVWWTRWPDAGIGIPTGEDTGLAVLDVDPRHGGDKTLAALVAECAPLPEGPHVFTGGGGDHYYFLHPGGSVPVAHGFRPGLDLQADGAYVVAPPSPHASGGSYSWAVPLLEGPSLPLLPPWLLRIAVEPQAHRGTQLDVPPPAGLSDSSLLDRVFAGPSGRLHRFVYESHLSKEHSKDHAAYVAFCTALLYAGAGEDQVPRLLGFTGESWDRTGRYQWRHLLRKGGYYRRRETLVRASSLYREAAEATRPEPNAREQTAAPVRAAPDVPAETGPAGASFPSDLFRAVRVKGGGGETTSVPVPEAFLGWLRSTEKFAVPIERGTFSSPSAFELLRYEGGYYNGTARAFIRGRVEDAHRRERIVSTDAFREEMVKGIGATSEFHRRRDAFNPPGRLCLANGILDTDTGSLLPHSPDVVFTWRLPVGFDPAASCPVFEEFLARVQPDPARRRMVEDLMGYCLERRNRFQSFFVNVGDGANGKTTWMRVLKELLGPDAIAAESLQNLSTQRFAPAELDGKLANLCDDLPYDRPLAATGVLKILTGEGEFTGERKFLPKFKFRFDGKLIANANRTPEVRDDTYAFWRRLVAIPWEVTIPEAERDPVLVDRLLAELPGILNLALRGLARCRDRSQFDPDSVFAGSREEWRSRADVVRAELLEDYEPTAGPEAFVPNRELYAWHVNRSQAEGREPLAEKAFGMRVARAFPLSRPERKMVAGRNVWGRPGLRRKKPSPVLDEAEAADRQYRLDEALKPPESAQGPATVVSRQSEGVTSPVLAGPYLSDVAVPGSEYRGGESTPARTGDVGGSGSSPGQLSYDPPAQRSETGDTGQKKRHGNCPSCVEFESHVCYVCEPCRWAENHREEVG